MDSRSIFSRNLHTYRKAANLTQESLAERCGLHRTYIGGLEQGRINPCLDNICKVAAALHVAPPLLLMDRTVTSATPATPATSATSATPAASATSSAPTASSAPATPSPAKKTAAGTGQGQPHAECFLYFLDDQGAEQLMPLDVHNEDLTMRILCELIERGYTGNDLVERYRLIEKQIDWFLGNC